MAQRPKDARLPAHPAAPTTRAARALAPVSLLALALASTACGAPPSSEDLSATESPRAAAPSEAERVQRFLDARYTATDVKHSFRAKWGETIDCLDFFAQPGVKALAAAGHPITEIPKPPPRPRRIGPSPRHAPLDPAEDYAFRGEPDEEGRPRACPVGSVPRIRVDAERIASAGGLDAYTRAMHVKTAPPPAGTPPDGDSPGFAHVVGSMEMPGISEGDSITSVFAPIVSNNNDHSLSQTWTLTGANLSVGAPCTSNCVQSVEVGWTVDPVINKGDTTHAHLFTYATNDGYWATGCYNDSIPSGFGPVAGIHCLPWVQVNTMHVPGEPLPNGVAGGASGQHELALTTWNGSPGGQQGWYVYATLDDDWVGWGDPLGYFPSSDYFGDMQTTAQKFNIGGEVAQSAETWTVAMGSGEDSSLGYGQAAYHRNIDVIANNTVFYGPGALSALSGGTAVDPYTYSATASAGPGWNEPYLFFGGVNVVHRRRWPPVPLL